MTRAGHRFIASAAVCACAVFALACLFPTVALGEPPAPPGAISLVAGPSQPVIATLLWGASASPDVSEYRVYAAVEYDGPYRAVGATGETGMNFVDGLPGVSYYFRVTAANALGEESNFSEGGPIASAWSLSPHGERSTSSSNCSQCHSVHQGGGTLLNRWEDISAGPQRICLSCHDGRNASTADVVSGGRDSFSLSSGHSFESTPTHDASIRGCETCHELHGSSTRARRIPARSINGTEVASAGRELCLACHTDNDDWYGPGYPAPFAPTRDATGYPVSGPWLGAASYEATSNAHRLIPETTQSPTPGEPVRREVGDCLYCHASHRGANGYDALLTSFRPTTSATLASDQSDGGYAQSCFDCHGPNLPAGFDAPMTDIEQFATATGPSAGHRVKTAGGTLPVGAPLPCYECHNPHGSTRGNSAMITDVLGAGLETSSSPAAVRAFCFTCHTTAGATPRGWDSTASAYVDVALDAQVVGLPRTGGVLHLPNAVGHAEADEVSCYGCHGKAYTPGGHNVHNPGSGDITAHESPTTSTCFGVGCHDESKDLPTVHELYVGPGSEFPQYDTVCALCHENEDPDRIDWAAATASCTPVCHDGITHSEYSTKHAVTSASSECTPCHGSDLATAHGAMDDFAKCATCHANPWNWGKSGDCLGCHNGVDVGAHVYAPPDPNHYEESTHTAAPFSAAVQGAGTDGVIASGGEECATCHSASLKAAHASTSASGGSVTCVECHTDTTLESTGTIAAGWPSGKCVDCHDVGSATTHDSFGTAHTVTPGTCAGTGSDCHDSADVAGLHATSQTGGAAEHDGCANADPTDPSACHSAPDVRPSAIDPDASCGEGSGGCHADKNVGNHGYSAARHAANPGAGDVLMAAGSGDSDHGAVWSTYVDCSLCHYSDLGTQHANACSTCHAGANPVASLGTWGGSCQQGDCHPSIHTGMTADHNGAYFNSSTSCDSCHIGTPTWPGDVDCTRCHAPADTIPDLIAPTTSSDATASYAGTATIHLTAVDNPGGSGVSGTYYILDGSAPAAGATVVVSAPTSGSAQHSLQYYSVDVDGNTEAAKPVPAFVFSVSAGPDVTAPTGTMSVNAGDAYTRSTPATVTANVSDAASGVDQMRIDPGTGAYGAWTAYAPTSPIDLPAGDGTKTVNAQYRDLAGNVAVLTDSILLDSTAPTTTSNAVASYTGTATVTLTAADAPSGSGVEGTYYRVDSGAQQLGNSIVVAPPSSGSASHSIQYWSIDRAGNPEAEQTATFTVAAPPSDTTPPTTTSSFAPASGSIFNAPQPVALSATDTGGSGLKGTYYRVDGGAFTPGASFTVSGEGLHTFSYYSADNANNTETVNVSNQFRIDTVAPLTTSNVTTGATYTGAQAFVLAPTDAGGSGVADTRWQLDSTAGAWTSGTFVPVVAPLVGSVSHTLYWASTDLAGNTETTRSVVFTVEAPPSGGTTTIQFRTNASLGGWSYVYWEVRDSGGNAIPGYSFFNDDSGHPVDMWADFVVPSGVGYQMYGEVGWMDPEEIVDTYTRDLSAAETTPGATITQWFY